MMVQDRSTAGPFLTARLKRLALPTHRHAFCELVRAGFRISDHNSFLGVTWSLLGPVLMMSVFYVIFRKTFGAHIPAYALYLMTGIVMVSFFFSAIRYMLQVFRTQRMLFMNTTLPREIIMGAGLVNHAYKFGIEVLFCGVLALFYNVLSWRFLFLVPAVALAFLVFTVGTGLILALLYSLTRDIEHIWVIVSRLLYFVTPVFYSLDKLDPWAAQLVYWLNPLTPFVLALRDAVSGGGAVPWLLYLHAGLVAVLAFAAGYGAFLRYESRAVERG